MKRPASVRATITILFAALALAGCGGGSAPDGDSSAVPEAETPAEARQAAAGADPCAPLDSELVRFDAAGTPFPYSFPYPEGWQVKTMFTENTVNADMITDVDGDGSTDYILRLGGSTDVVGNVDRLVELNRSIDRIEEVLEVDLGDRTLYVSRSRMGDLVGFSGLFPVPGQPNSAYTFMGGITHAPKTCRDRAEAVMQEIMLGLRPNPEVAPAPTAG